MGLLTTAAAHAAYRASRPDEALDITGRMLGEDPNDPEAHLIRGLIALRRGDAPSCIAAFKACLAARTGEWVLERYRRDAELHRPAGLTLDMTLKLGGFFRGALPSYGPAIRPDLRRADHEFVNVVGSSYVRSFGGSPAVFPLYVGQGPYTLLLDDASAAVTRRLVMANLRRLDPRRNVMFALGSDPSYYLQGVLKRGEHRPDGATPADFAAMDEVAERHRLLLSEAKALVSGEVILLGITPHVDDATNQLGLYLNTRLKAVCADLGVSFLDAWDTLVDPASGHLRDDISAKAYPGDAHFAVEATKLFIELLQRNGSLSGDVAAASDYRWSHVFEVDIDPADKTRLWCEPSIHPRNTFQSHKIASAHLEKLVADLLIGLGSQRADQALLMANVREAHLPNAVPAHVQAGCLAFTDSEDNLKVGRMVLDFYGRLDVQLELPDRFDLVTRQAWDRVALLLHPDSLEADEARCNAILERLPQSVGVVVATPRPDRLSELRLGGRSLVTMSISNRHIPEEWRAYSIVVARGA